MELHSQNIRCTMQKVEQSNSNFKVIDTIEQGNPVVLFGTFTYKSIATGKGITSPFGLLARFDGGKGRVHSVSRRQL